MAKSFLIVFVSFSATLNSFLIFALNRITSSVKDSSFVSVRAYPIFSSTISELIRSNLLFVSDNISLKSISIFGLFMLYMQS